MANHLNEYKDARLSKQIQSDRRNDTLTIKKIIHHHLTTRFQLSNGHYITANKKFIIFK
ncbi:DUF5776 domain-containing protein [Secundilactobacillus oryzae]|uniref:DUF5776 domain-containing protein n=1 Tax=Secundilactobacillus oryzae TaxID=1202668 RepID=UPI0020922718|nr:DUF5776 domain-containing protein [Secundilactobacillus oryzae]